VETCSRGTANHPIILFSPFSLKAGGRLLPCRGLMASRNKTPLSVVMSYGYLSDPSRCLLEIIVTKEMGCFCKSSPLSNHNASPHHRTAQRTLSCTAGVVSASTMGKKFWAVLCNSALHWQNLQTGSWKIEQNSRTLKVSTICLKVLTQASLNTNLCGRVVGGREALSSTSCRLIRADGR